MITLQPSKSVLECYSVDFKALSLAVNVVLQMIYGRQLRGTINVLKSKTWSHYRRCGANGRIRIDFDSNPTCNDVISVITHEMRHWQQDFIFKCKFDQEDVGGPSYESYFNSPLETDARHFQRVENEIKKIYHSLVAVKTKNDQYCFTSMLSKVEAMPSLTSYY